LWDWSLGGVGGVLPAFWLLKGGWGVVFWVFFGVGRGVNRFGGGGGKLIGENGFMMVGFFIGVFLWEVWFLWVFVDWGCVGGVSTLRVLGGVGFFCWWLILVLGFGGVGGWMGSGFCSRGGLPFWVSFWELFVLFFWGGLESGLWGMWGGGLKSCFRGGGGVGLTEGMAAFSGFPCGLGGGGGVFLLNGEDFRVYT